VNFKSFLLESDLQTQYVVKKISPTHFEVAKFNERKQPEGVSDVYIIKGELESAGYRKGMQNERAISIVKQWLDAGKPLAVYYTVDDQKKIHQHKIFDADEALEYFLKK